MGVNVNQSNATSTAYAGSNLTIQDARLQTDGDAKARTITNTWANNQRVISDAVASADVNVLTVGTATVNAAVRPATFTLSVVGVGASKARAEQNGTQAATLQLGNGGIEKAGNVSVQSVVSGGGTRAVIGTSGVSEKTDKDGTVKIGAVSVDVNTARAVGNLTSTAAILGGPTGYNTEMGWVDEGEFVTEHRVYTNYDNVLRLAWRDTKTGEILDLDDLEMAKRIVLDCGGRWLPEFDTDDNLIDAVLNMSKDNRRR